jgi:hypothetical protein
MTFSTSPAMQSVSEPIRLSAGARDHRLRVAIPRAQLTARLLPSTWVVLTAPAGDCLSGAHKSGQSAR